MSPSPIDRVFEAIVPRAVDSVNLDAVMDELDIDAVVQRVDIDAIVQKVDVDELVAKVDLDALLAKVDLDELLGRIDVDALLARIDLDMLLQKVDLDGLLAKVDLNALLQHVDLDRLLTTVDLNRLLTTVDLNALLAKVDLDTLLTKVDLNRLLTTVDLNALLAGVDLDALLTKVDLNRLLAEVDLNLLLAKVDLDALLATVDLNRLLTTVDLDALLQHVDLDALLTKVDLNRLLAGVDLDALLAGVDLDALLAKVDMETVVKRANIDSIVRDASRGVFARTIDTVRRQLVGLDVLMIAAANRTFRRKDAETTDVVEGQVTGRIAGGASRMAAYLVDTAVVSVSFGLLSALAVFLVELFSGRSYQPSGHGWIWMASYGTFFFLYWWIGLSVTGRSIGKALFGLRVVSMDGTPISPGRSALRVIVYPFSFILGLGLIPIVTGRRRRALHDHAGGDKVVYDWGDRPAELPAPLTAWVRRHVDPTNPAAAVTPAAVEPVSRTAA